MYIHDTIAAISTPQGAGGIGIVRVSGAAAQEIGLKIFRFKRGADFVSHYLHYGEIVDPLTGSVIDEALAVLMKAPHSYTCEDVLELQVHGGLLVVERVLAAALFSGARLADAGEFTRRAFLNGRIDLLEAEGVMDVIASRSDASLALASRQMKGELSKRIGAVMGELRHALALVEAYIDFPEDDIGDADKSAILNRAISSRNQIADMIDSFEEGRIVRDGIAVMIVGKPNAGKSSLLNRLLGEERAIVTHIAGTTRDIIEETANIDGLAVRLLDTAGIRDTDDIVERYGIDRALEAIPLADLVLFVIDKSRPFDAEDRLIFDALQQKKMLIVQNKSDIAPLTQLPLELQNFPCCNISSVTGEGIFELKKCIKNLFIREGRVDSRDFVAISRVRHRDALSNALQALNRFVSSMENGGELETLSIDMRDALDAVGEVTGETTTDDLLDIIFSSFCIGK